MGFCQFPCGCRGYFEILKSGKKRLVIIVNPKCKWDAPRVGRIESHVRYVGKDER